MIPSQSPNYLLSNRKRLALTQEDVAFLLDLGSKDQVCRHERFAREPNLETALAYEVVFRRSASEIFGGLYQKVESEVASRAKTLAAKPNNRKPNQRTAHRQKVLSDLAGLNI